MKAQVETTATARVRAKTVRRWVGVVAAMAAASSVLAVPSSAVALDPVKLSVATIEALGATPGDSLPLEVRDHASGDRADTSESTSYIKTCRKAAKRFLRFANKKKYRKAKKMTFYRADMRRVRDARNDGYRFKLKIHCDRAYDMPEGYSTSSTLLYQNSVAGSVWTHADGPKGKPKKWKFWDIWPVVGE